MNNPGHRVATPSMNGDSQQVAMPPASADSSKKTTAEIAMRGESTCKVVDVSDGDTLTCLTADKHQLKIRLSQIDAPEKKQAFSNAATKALSNYVFGKIVSLKTNGKDQYGCTIAEVFSVEKYQ